MNVGILTISMCGIFSTGWTMGVFYCIWCGVLPFYFQTWEEFNTGKLFLPWFNGPTEGLLMAIGSGIISFIYGSQFWQTVMNHLI